LKTAQWNVFWYDDRYLKKNEKYSKETESYVKPKKANKNMPENEQVSDREQSEQDEDTLDDKVKEGIQMMDGLTDEVRRISKIKGVNTAFDRIGKHHINSLCSYMRSKQAGTIYEKLRRDNIQGAGTDMAEILGTLALFDVPGVLTPALDVYNDILEMKDGSVLQKKVSNMNEDIHIIMCGSDSMENKVQHVSEKLHFNRDSIAQAIDDVIQTVDSKLVTKLSRAGNSMKAFNGDRSSNMGDALVKIGGTMHALSILQAGSKFYENIQNEEYKDVVDQGIIIGASMASLVDISGDCENLFGSIGNTAETVIGGISNIYSMTKPIHYPNTESVRDLQDHHSGTHKSLKEKEIHADANPVSKHRTFFATRFRNLSSAVC